MIPAFPTPEKTTFARRLGSSISTRVVQYTSIALILNETKVLSYHQTFQVPKKWVLTSISSM